MKKALLLSLLVSSSAMATPSIFGTLNTPMEFDGVYLCKSKTVALPSSGINMDIEEEIIFNSDSGDIILNDIDTYNSGGIVRHTSSKTEFMGMTRWENTVANKDASILEEPFKIAYTDVFVMGKYEDEIHFTYSSLASVHIGTCEKLEKTDK